MEEHGIDICPREYAAAALKKVIKHIEDNCGNFSKSACEKCNVYMAYKVLIKELAGHKRPVKCTYCNGKGTVDLPGGDAPEICPACEGAGVIKSEGGDAEG